MQTTQTNIHPSSTIQPTPSQPSYSLIAYPCPDNVPPQSHQVIHSYTSVTSHSPVQPPRLLGMMRQRLPHHLSIPPLLLLLLSVDLILAEEVLWHRALARAKAHGT